MSEPNEQPPQEDIEITLAVVPDDAEAAAAEAAKAAPDKARSFKWRGLPLHPLNVERMVRYRTLRVADGGNAGIVFEFDRIGADARIMLWLCHHDSKEWREPIGKQAPLFTRPVEWLDQIVAWAEHNIGVNEIDAAADLLWEIYVNSQAPRVEIIPDDETGGESGNALGQVGTSP